jgi:hypothetical protein
MGCWLEPVIEPPSYRCFLLSTAGAFDRVPAAVPLVLGAVQPSVTVASVEKLERSLAITSSCEMV